MFLLYKKTSSYILRENGIQNFESMVYEEAEQVTFRPCLKQTQTMEQSMHFIPNANKSIFIPTIIENLKSCLLPQEEVRLWVEETYRSHEPEVSRESIVTNCAAYYECQSDEKVMYDIIHNEGELVETEQILARLYSMRRANILPEHSYAASLRNLPHIFEAMAADVLSHELLGHIFEIDNYHYYQYSKYIKKIEQLNVEIRDDPHVMEFLGMNITDDALVDTKKTVIFDKGHFTGELIGGQEGDSFCSRSFRRSSWSKIAIPRMSTLRISAASPLRYLPTEYIRISNIRKAKVYHSTGRISLFITDAIWIKNDLEVAQISPFTMELMIQDVFHRLIACSATDSPPPLRFTQCYKKGQVITCGIQTNDWLLQS